MKYAALAVLSLALAAPAPASIPTPRAVLTVAAMTPDELVKAKEQLTKLLESLKTKIAAETDRDRKLELYDWRDQVEASLAAVDKAIAASAIDPKAEEKKSKAEAALAEARVLNQVLASLLGDKDFFDVHVFKQENVTIDLSADLAYDAICRRLPFLRGVGRGGVTIRAGEEMAARFNTIKAQYFAALLEAKAALQDAGKAPMQDARYKGFINWGNNTKFSYDGRRRNSFQIITNEEYRDLN